ncbi:MAG: SHOCT domain-containing protein [Ilumatobacter sp.]|nr:SHOCT domain-containing protein [Ilumatobacter sp.]
MIQMRFHMLLAAEFGTGQVLWSMLWFFLFFLWIMLIFNVIGDIFRSDDLSGWGKALWTIFIVFVPYLGVFVYLIARGSSMAQRQVNHVQAQQAAVQDYIRTTANGSGVGAADQLASLAELHTAGKLSDEEFAAAKTKVIKT